MKNEISIYEKLEYLRRDFPNKKFKLTVPELTITTIIEPNKPLPSSGEITLTQEIIIMDDEGNIYR